MNTLQDGQVRALTLDERKLWGRCPDCGAPSGWPCKSAIYGPLSISRDNGSVEHGAHEGRLAAAPAVVRLVPVLDARPMMFDEGARWGECPICHAAHGEACTPVPDVSEWQTVCLPPVKLVHYDRIERAPRVVRAVPVP